MTRFGQALSVLKTHKALSLTYCFCAVLLLALFRTGLIAVGQQGGKGAASSLDALAGVGVMVLFVLAYSMMQAWFYGRLGAGAGGTLWRWQGTVETLKRYVMPWLLLNLLSLTFADLTHRAALAGNTQAAGFFESLTLCWHLISMPAGVCILFYRGLVWRELHEALVPLFRFPGALILPMALAFLQYLHSGVQAAFVDETASGMLLLCAVTDIPQVILDLIIFVLYWRICMDDCLTPREEDDDYEF
ncbi:MAG TPA: hypothetical protein PLY90_09780 [Candidatus Hydrogenedentes bacterium]|jgi:hypothetical protein|nr:MAG: hypothetical protein BWY07_01058 [Candidatus Hydrogenedentes bacterium ADurb.Bin170]HOD96539.1 hypothetical protein [Candidatus Hydrogenedentota bacterium]HOR51928.1 hypothetical protein [Candidatus Hydrogenedentota bacterium]HPK25957.1 hypothetical protein [Candidatus Hydrogenedentota bacterium]HPX87517.1 hypothetical protein [Candidatus Hydrogenedentota bacterium]